MTNTRRTDDAEDEGDDDDDDCDKFSWRGACLETKHFARVPWVWGFDCVPIKTECFQKRHNVFDEQTGMCGCRFRVEGFL